jgi:capsular exopolysaccharide synthesis family protein
MNSIEFRRPDGPRPDLLDTAFVPVQGSGKGAASVVARYLSVLRRRKWTIVGFVIGGILLALVVTLLMTPQYTATETVEIQREGRNFTNVEGAEADTNSVDLEFYETQYGLLRARSLADRVATDLKLFDDESFFRMFHASDSGTWFQNGRLTPGAPKREERIRVAGDILLDKLKVSPARLSRLVDVSFTSPSPEFSRRIVDAWGKHFIQMSLERRYEASSYARNFLEQRLAALRAKIDESELAVVRYASREGIVNLPATVPASGEGGVTGERSLVADDLATLNRELARATADRVLAQSRLGTRGDAVTEALENQAITSMRAKRAELAADYSKLLTQFEPEYPPARAIKMQLDQLDRSISNEEARVRRALEQTYSAQLERENALKERVNALKTGVLDLRRRSIQYNIYQRDADTNRQLYDALLQRYKEIGVAGGVGVNNISIVDIAEQPKKPSSPRPLLNLLLGLIAGCVVGAAAALALEQIDEEVTDPGEIEKLLAVPLLGTIPTAEGGEPLALLDDRKSSLSEAYLSLQTALSFSTDHGLPRVLAVTSSRPAEGKTTTSFALARSLARTNRRVLLVDSDMRSPSIHHLVNGQNQAGLSNFLAGSDGLDELVHQTPFSNLFVMTAGPQPPNAAELLSSERFERLKHMALERFDQIVVDAPPVMGLADAPLVASHVDATVFVIEFRGTKRSVARVALERLRAANANLVGAVLTKFDVRRAHYGYGYDYGYGYGYGDSSRKGKPQA